MKGLEETIFSRSNPRNHWMVRLWEEYCTKFSVCSSFEDDTDELQLVFNDCMGEWQTYASKFTVSPPEEQLPPDIWDDKDTKPNEQGAYPAALLKNWRFWTVTREFLRSRYGVLTKPTYTFDCQVLRLKHPLVAISPEDRLFHNYPSKGDPPEWYAQAIQMTVFNSEIRFRCRSLACPRHRCDLRTRSSVDIYGLLAVFERLGRMHRAQKIFAEWLAIKIVPLKSYSSEKELPKRYKVSCTALEQLLGAYKDLRDDKVGGKEIKMEFLNAVSDLIRFSPLEEYRDKPADEGYVYLPRSVVYESTLWKMGTAARLWLWMCCYQSQRARQKKKRIKEFKPSDKLLAKLWGISESTVKRQRKKLKELGYFAIVGAQWRVYFNPKS